MIDTKVLLKTKFNFWLSDCSVGAQSHSVGSVRQSADPSAEAKGKNISPIIGELEMLLP